jgi:methylisocitrate lyase
MLREKLASKEALVTPGAYDCLTAKLVEAAGFPAVSISGAAVTAARLGAPDMGLISMTEMLDVARRIVRCVSIPVMADCETGFGGPLNVMRTVSEFEEAGVASLFIEDQVATRRCGHFRGKQLIDAEEMSTKIRAAVQARSDPDLVLIARTDALALTGMEGAVERAEAYARAGVDVIYVEAPSSIEEIEALPRRLEPLGLPLYMNVVEGGVTPVMPVKYYEELGYRIVNFSGSSQKVAIKAMQALLAHLFLTGDVDEFYPSRMVSLDERSELLGLEALYQVEDALNKESPAGMP